MSTSHYDILREKYEDEREALELEEYDSLCDAGYEGTFEDFRREKAEFAKLEEPPKAIEIGDEDIPF